MNLRRSLAPLAVAVVGLIAVAEMQPAAQEPARCTAA